MKFVADLHLHSKYSRAVSQNMQLGNMAAWAKLKGINVVGTGDFTHPFWFDKLRTELVEAGNGLYRLKQGPEDIYFMLTCEISSIYSQGGKGRRIHTLFMFPDMESVEKFNQELIRRHANLRSDGRPIVGIKSRDLAEIALAVNERVLIIPAHIWTPWFSLYGSFSGFDSIEECFGDTSKYIYGIETGLSSDPAMNWKIADLDKRSILSFSDAHSLPKMGREVTVFEGREISYDCIYNAIKVTKEQRAGGDKEIDSVSFGSSVTSVPSKIAFTIEFYPEEGKYHFTGHRNCNFSQSPEETVKNGNVCPKCSRSLTIGVMHRVEELKSQNSNLKTEVKNGVRWCYSEEGRPPYVTLVPLSEILAEALGVAVGTRKVEETFINLVKNFGSEFGVLMKADLMDITKYAGARISEAVGRVRGGDIVVEPGYDGKFGVVKIWQESKIVPENETEALNSEAQLNLFA